MKRYTIFHGEILVTLTNELIYVSQYISHILIFAQAYLILGWATWPIGLLCHKSDVTCRELVWKQNFAIDVQLFQNETVQSTCICAKLWEIMGHFLSCNLILAMESVWYQEPHIKIKGENLAAGEASPSWAKVNMHALSNSLARSTPYCLLSLIQNKWS